MSENAHNLVYNSKKEDLIMPEYGRHIQEMIKHAKTIEDPEERQAFMDKVVGLMIQITPQNRNIEDVRERTWQHVFRIAKYDIDVDTPNGEIPTPEAAKKRPKHMGYPRIQKKFKHYGNNVQALVEKALEMEDGDMKDDFVEVIGSYMKLAFKTWNREHYVSDDIIIEDLAAMSDGKLVPKDNARLDTLARANSRRSNNNNKNRSKDNNRGGGRGRNNNNRGRNNNNKGRGGGRGRRK